jgi:hypothetical protein
LVEVRVCIKKSFHWRKFKYVCTEYGVEIKGKKFKFKKFLKQFPVKPDMNIRNATTIKPTAQNDLI